MNTFFALLMAGSLLTAPMSNPADGTVNPTESTHYASEQLAIWLTPDQKLHVMLSQGPTVATVKLSDKTGDYVMQYINLRKRSVNQRYDLSELPTGTYQLTVRVGEQITTKTVVVGQATSQRQVAIQ